ncbi:hypothetical protein HNP86_000218 [Methanococcus maripaludis]|uniref:DUF357 domain-containing protein n=1 Tax=Methanococcus maripaludis TaxID=39152 RepID=Q9P9E8_METMI|nr:DUF357 domain-containing protein [Methanococcus maripaludis]AAF91261.1 hypothetical protein [Methanococcus maripaludis]AVB76709.1 hypothetical protein MMJJ_13300 [Methanococcus maripaludis]MBA2850087.1 hypothetical protein [Methanococcus maripaludis]MBA2863218.1 hypothetical protein [Methanococcus maripaludis]MBB6067259.1 hypothetical protein [Methanococcus maripaludis]
MVEIDNIITDKKIENYFERTKEAITIIKNGLPPEKSLLSDVASDFLVMIDCYFEDAKTFIDKGDYINAFASLNYAYGWIDAGARLGIFNVGDDDVRFTLAK